MDFNKKMAKANETKAAVKANEIKSTAKETVTTAKNVVKTIFQSPPPCPQPIFLGILTIVLLVFNPSSLRVFIITLLIF